MSTARTSPTRHLDEGELDDVVEATQRAGAAHLLRRLCFVKNWYAGDSATEAGRRVGVSSATASRWARRWEADGVDGLRREPRSGRPPALDSRDRETLATTLQRRSRWTAEEIERLIEREFGVAFSTRHVYRIVDDLGMSDRIGRVGPSRRATDDPVEDDVARSTFDTACRSDGNDPDRA